MTDRDAAEELSKATKPGRSCLFADRGGRVDLSEIPSEYDSAFRRASGQMSVRRLGVLQ